MTPACAWDTKLIETTASRIRAFVGGFSSDSPLSRKTDSRHDTRTSLADFKSASVASNQYAR